MLSLLKRSRPTEAEARPSSPAERALVADLHYELVPMASIDAAIDALPDGSNVSVTCSPVKGIAATLAVCERLVARGHIATPHLAARMVGSRTQAAELSRWCDDVGIGEVFVIAGDASEPHGPYEGALPFIVDLLAAPGPISRIGIAGYPDGHASIDEAIVVEQLHAKQAVLVEADVEGWVSTQMCFDVGTIRSWLLRERASGMTLPVRLGLPGVVDRTRLMTMGTRLGIGASMRYLAKNRSTVTRMLAPGGFDPTEIVEAFAADAASLGIEALHSFTFNAVAETRAWHDAMMYDRQEE
jgi:methylenetetrahydrofolate reductase (NADPH)